MVEHRHLLFKIEKAFPECNEEACVQIYENVLKCVSNKRYVSMERFINFVEYLDDVHF